MTLPVPEQRQWHDIYTSESNARLSVHKQSQQRSLPEAFDQRSSTVPEQAPGWPRRERATGTSPTSCAEPSRPGLLGASDSFLLVAGEPAALPAASRRPRSFLIRRRAGAGWQVGQAEMAMALQIIDGTLDSCNCPSVGCCTLYVGYK
jgi:hypothetical protein